MALIANMGGKAKKPTLLFDTLTDLSNGGSVSVPNAGDYDYLILYVNGKGSTLGNIYQYLVLDKTTGQIGWSFPISGGGRGGTFVLNGTSLTFNPVSAGWGTDLVAVYGTNEIV